MHNVKIIYLAIATFVSNCYSSKSRLFIIGNWESKSTKGTTHDDPIEIMHGQQLTLQN